MKNLKHIINYPRRNSLGPIPQEKMPKVSNIVFGLCDHYGTKIKTFANQTRNSETHSQHSLLGEFTIGPTGLPDPKANDDYYKYGKKMDSKNFKSLNMYDPNNIKNMRRDKSKNASTDDINKDFF